MQLFVMGGNLLSSSISNVLPAFHSGLSPCQNLLLEGRQYVVDVDVDRAKKSLTAILRGPWNLPEVSNDWERSLQRCCF